MTLRILIVTFIKTAEEHHAVGVLCLLHRLSYKFIGSAGLVKPLLGNDSVVLADGVAHISTGIIYPYLIAVRKNIRNTRRTLSSSSFVVYSPFFISSRYGCARQ